MLINLPFNPLDGGRAAMFDDFNRSNDRFSVKGAFYEGYSGDCIEVQGDHS